MAGSPSRIMCQTKNKICFASGLQLTQKIEALTCLLKPPDPNLYEQLNLEKVVLCPPRAKLIYYQKTEIMGYQARAHNMVHGNNMKSARSSCE